MRAFKCHFFRTHMIRKSSSSRLHRTRALCSCFSSSSCSCFWCYSVPKCMLGLCVFGSPASLRMQWKFFLLSILCTSCQFINHFCLSVCIFLCSTWPLLRGVYIMFSLTHICLSNWLVLPSLYLSFSAGLLSLALNMIYFNHYAKWFFCASFFIFRLLHRATK